MLTSNTKIFIILLSFFFFTYGVNYAQEWEQMSSIDFERNHGIGFAIDGYGYILTGGDSKSPNTDYHSKSFNRYDSQTDTWEELEDYPGPSRGYGIGDVWNGKLYFGFGIDANFVDLNDLWEFDPITNEFTELPSCPCVGRAHPGLVVTDGKLYMGTGSGPTGNLDDFWEYDIVTQVWTEKANLPGKRHHPYQFVIDGQVYMGSGHRETWFKYDAENDAWIQLSNLDDRVAGTQFAYKGRGYVLSGVDNDHERFTTGQFWQYLPEVDSWLELEAHPDVSRWAPASFIIDGYVYMATGWDGPGDHLSVWRYNLEEENPTNTAEENPVRFSVYPNPTTDYLTIDIADGKQLAYAKIIDVKGQEIKNVSSHTSTISVQELIAGQYWLYFEIEGASYKKSFVKN